MILSWRPPLFAGGTITGYVITSSQTGSVSVAGNATGTVMTGLTNGSPYSFSVSAVNSAGTGPVLMTNVVIPLRAAVATAPPLYFQPSSPVPTPSSISPGGTPAFTVSLYYGLRTAGVKTLQLFFVKQGYLSASSATGFFGALTQKAVQKFQCDEDIVCAGDPGATGWGFVGAKTRKALNALTQ